MRATGMNEKNEEAKIWFYVNSFERYEPINNTELLNVLRNNERLLEI